MLRLTLLTAILLGSVIDVLRCDVCDDEGDGFKCNDGTFIECMSICNGRKDCPDGSDEFLENNIKLSPCKDYLCPYNYVSCKYGGCIPFTSLCDSRPDCADGSDEWKYYCTKHPRDPSGMKACESGEFIKTKKFCDGKIDCHSDGSDERPFQCLLMSCPTDKYFRCRYGGCIPDTKKCNQIFDCLDHSDEDDCPKSVPVNSSAPLEGCEIEKDPNYYIRNENENSNIFTGENGRVPVNTRIIIKCRNNFFFNGNRSEIRRTCTRDGWNHKLPHCIKYCNSRILRSSMSTVVKCKLHGSIVDCQNIVPGTTAEVSCADGYSSDPEQYTMSCESEAEWDKVKRNCQPVCGREMSSTEPSASASPWHVGVKTYLDQKCGGTIVSPKSVITALHCVQTEERDSTLNVTDVFVTIAGDLKNGSTHIFSVNVSEIIVEGDIDVALLKLSKILILSMNIRPICIDYSENIESITNTFLHGWTENQSKFDDIFHRTNLEVLPLVNCSANLNRTYMCVRPIYDSSKIETLCEGHSGSGIIVENLYGVNYIIGIVSYKPSHTNGCSNEPVVAILFDQIPQTLKKSIQSDKEGVHSYK